MASTSWRPVWRMVTSNPCPSSPFTTCGPVGPVPPTTKALMAGTLSARPSPARGGSTPGPAVELPVLQRPLDHRATPTAGFHDQRVGVALAQAPEHVEAVGAGQVGRVAGGILRLVDGQLGHAQLERVVLRHPPGP